MKKEHLLLIFAVLASLISIGIAFVFESIYAGMYSILLFSIVFLIALDRIMIKNLNPRNKIVLRLVFVLFAGLTFGNVLIQLQKGNFQEDILVQIRQTIDEGITKVKVHNVVLTTMRNYQFPTDGEKSSVKETFLELYGDRLDEEGNFNPLEIGETYDGEIEFKFEVLFPDENTVQMRAISKVGQGKNLDFQNANGYVGKMQSLATLTPNGVIYEREN